MSRYVCPQCLRGINPFFALPPLQPTVACAGCGHPVSRTVGAFAQAWARFFFLMTFLAAWAGFTFTDPIHNRERWGFEGCVGAGLMLGLFTSIAGALVGWLLGNLVGLWVGAPWKDECMPTWRQFQVAENVADAETEAQLQGAFCSRPAARPERLTTRRCWHCGSSIEVDTSGGAAAVRCPGCRANLGTVAPGP